MSPLHLKVIATSFILVACSHAFSQGPTRFTLTEFEITQNPGRELTPAEIVAHVVNPSYALFDPNANLFSLPMLVVLPNTEHTRTQFGQSYNECDPLQFAKFAGGKAADDSSVPVLDDQGVPCKATKETKE